VRHAIERITEGENMKNRDEKIIMPISIWKSILIFLFPTIGIIIAWKIGIPFFKSIGFPKNVAYMVSMTFVLLPLLVASMIGFIKEGNKFSFKGIAIRFRIKPLSKNDFIWLIIGFLIILVFSGIMQFGIEYICNSFGIKYETIPPELGFRIIPKNEWWIFLIHTFYFLSNILGEEFLYRGYILPRQEIKHGRSAWIINGTLWTMTHIGTGLSIVTMIPLLFVVPFIVQKQKNTLVGIILHGLIAGMGFYLTAFGLMK